MRVRRLLVTDTPRYRELMLLAYGSEPEAFTSTPEERAAQSDAEWARRIEDPKGLSEAF